MNHFYLKYWTTNKFIILNEQEFDEIVAGVVDKKLKRKLKNLRVKKTSKR